MNKIEYKNNPTRSSSLSYFKTLNFRLPENIKVLRDDNFSQLLLDDYNDEKYFKLVHYLENIENIAIDSQFFFDKCVESEIIKHINDCYNSESISLEDVENYRKMANYDECLWICIRHKKTFEIVASGIADFYEDIREGHLDWIQVSEKYRRKGLGKAIVNKLLELMKDKADFATVSGKVDNTTNPEKLYLSCGFKEECIWHILTKKNSNR